MNKLEKVLMNYNGNQKELIKIDKFFNKKQNKIRINQGIPHN